MKVQGGSDLEKEINHFMPMIQEPLSVGSMIIKEGIAHGK